MIKVLFFFCLLLSLSCFAGQEIFDVYSKAALLRKVEGEVPIKRIQLFGERCSGTNYLALLLKRNINGINPNFFQYGYKHFPCWYDFPYDGQSPLSHYTLEESDDTLFIVIFRHPFDWVRSLCINPWHADSSLKMRSLSQFIRLPWKVEQGNKDVFLKDMNPETFEPFDNILHLRTARILNMLRLRDLVKNVYYVNYEAVRDFPSEFLEEISALFCLSLKEDFHPISTYKDQSSPYRKSAYPPISEEDLAFIRQNLSSQIEESIGYDIYTD